ncbi:ApeA N-terminal domain 1-containing protein [Haloplasma contractile]|uniref:ApeA N-terminal domain-containing protein n=1 Tax=Haloplasma contractile SSD-17B TaxID=1033810 RepID=F7PSC3_9MOLU|nr:hypothetical protein [Haloplasma contractile]ERJ11040.1 hypothetical protein HLPCO_002931 [Haloplasma contractile SSD-17B]
MLDNTQYFISLYINNNPINYNGKILEDHNTLRLEMTRICDSYPKEEQEAFRYVKLDKLTCQGFNGKKYLFCNLLIVNTKTYFSQDNKSVISHYFTFTDLIENPSDNYLYSHVNFTFTKIEQLFERTTFNTQFPTDVNNNELILSLKVPQDKEIKISKNKTIIFSTHFNGLVSSDHLFDVSIKQEKQIQLKYNDLKSIEEIYDDIDKIKLYFEFLLNTRIKIKDINFLDTVKYNQTNLMLSKYYFEIINENTKIKNRFRGSIDELGNSMVLWFSLIEKFHESINIWKKTIYNQTIDERDLFLWNCQAFETLCQKDENIYNEALKHTKAKNTRLQYPNLSDYMKAIEKVIDFSINNGEKYYKDVVKVRDKFTHNNPKKIVSEEQIKQSFDLIKYFYTSLIASKLGNMKIARSVMLN